MAIQYILFLILIFFFLSPNSVSIASFSLSLLFIMVAIAIAVRDFVHIFLDLRRLSTSSSTFQQQQQQQQRWVFGFLLMGAMAAMAQSPFQHKHNFGRLPQQQLQQVGPKCALVVPKGNGWDITLHQCTSCPNEKPCLLFLHRFIRVLLFWFCRVRRESCVTIESINRAFNKASREFRLVESRDETYSEQLAETLLETSRLLALE